MSPPQLARILPVSPVTEVAAPVEPFVTDCHRNALDRLRLAFDSSLPLALLIGEGRSGANFVIGQFLADIASDDVSIARITRPCSDAMTGMRYIIKAIGFDPKDMNLADLEKIFTMFLSYQRTHRRRTVICIEEAQECDCWMLDKVRRLVEMESAGKYGLVIILSGQPSLNRQLGEPPLSAIRGQTRERIYLAPLSEAESRTYIQRRLELAGDREIAQVFDFHSIGLIHEISAGVPDVLSKLCSRCLALLEEENFPLVTPEVVGKASEQLQLQTSSPISGFIPLVDAKPVAAAEKEPLADERFVVRLDGEIMQEKVLSQGHLLIGRDVMCDICVNHLTVSRYHSLLVRSVRGIRVVDLGSTNGTQVNGRRFRQYTLRDNDVITIGACKIQYFSAADKLDLEVDTGRTDSFEAHDPDNNVIDNEVLSEIGSLGLNGSNPTLRH
jgi:general secretion pathway protein A